MLVTAFGLARSTTELPGKYATEVPQTNLCTAPEQVIGDWATVDRRADLWALGTN